MSASESFNNNGSVKELVAHYETMSNPSSSPSLAAATVATSGRSGSDSGRQLPIPPTNTPEMDPAGLAVPPTQPALPQLTERQAYGLIVHEAMTTGERLTPVQRYNLLVSLDPNSTDPRLALLLAERRRRGIHLGEQVRRPLPPLITSAQVLARGIHNDFVPRTPINSRAPPSIVSNRSRGSSRGRGVGRTRGADRARGPGRGRGMGRGSVLSDPTTPAIPARNPRRVISKQ